MKKIVASAILSLIAANSFALTKQEFIQNLPDNMRAKITDVKPLGDGLYYVFTEGSYFITSEHGQYIIPAPLTTVLDVKTNKSVTESYQKAFADKAKDKLSTYQKQKAEQFGVDFKKALVDLESISVINKTNITDPSNSKKLYVFTDPDCPFCRKFELTIAPELKNVEIINIMWPLTDLHPNAQKNATNILCSKDSYQALLSNFKSDKPNSTKSCSDASKASAISSKITEVQKKWRDILNVNGTPLLTNGKFILPGAQPAKVIMEELSK